MAWNLLMSLSEHTRHRFIYADWHYIVCTWKKKKSRVSKSEIEAASGGCVVRGILWWPAVYYLFFYFFMSDAFLKDRNETVERDRNTMDI